MRSSRQSVRADRIAAAAIVATVAFWAYTQTLLPGDDLGDTGGFQAAVLWPATSARQAYPLYYGLAKPFVGMLSAATFVGCPWGSCSSMRSCAPGGDLDARVDDLMSSDVTRSKA